MKLRFEPDLQHQRAAIEAACDLFRGAELCRSEFTVFHRSGEQLEALLEDNALGIGNRLTLLPEEVERNLRDVQLRNGVRRSNELTADDYNFTVEMETGTGKTYVYLRTIYELNKRYGFSKFVIVVPSVAIREGVLKSLDITRDHFHGLYGGVPASHFVYDSARLGEVRDFATSSHIRIMVVTVGSINRFGDEAEAAAMDARDNPKANIMYRPREQVGGERPIDLIHATRPIVIVDEPQSVEGRGGTQGAEAVRRLKPLATFRYSATHLREYHRIYTLDAVDAYQQKLVKQIEVAGATIQAAANKPFVRLVKVEARARSVRARVELDVQTPNGVQRQEKWVQETDDLEQTSGNRAVYRDVRVGELRAGRAGQRIEIRHPGGETWLEPGEAFGDVDPLQVQRQMINRTIREHLTKERAFRQKGIKVLSLFFVERVSLYREYDDAGNPSQGVYARMFEEEYRRLRSHPDFADLFADATPEDVSSIHDGYFSRDRKKVGGRTVEIEKDTSGETKADDDAYHKILQAKEQLLSLEEPLRFIFSHSALREGWDNPNVFQICALRDIQTERERRQSIGRGLRLCVNQNGDRQHGFDVNTLTVVARESYESFAEGLQKELEDPSTGIGLRFGFVEAHQFANIPVTLADGSAGYLGDEHSKAIWKHLREAGYIDAQGKVQDALRTALKSGTVALPESVEAQRAQITGILLKHAGGLEVKNADDRRTFKVNREVLLSDDFRALWDRVKHRTTYRVHFDNATLIADCIRALQDAPPIGRTRMQWETATLDIERGGVHARRGELGAPVVLSDGPLDLPDILTELQNRTQLTRRSIAKILIDSGRLEDFRVNPQQFIDVAAHAINRRKALAIVDGIKYRRLGDGEVWAQELFQNEEVTGYLRNLVAAGPRSVYDYVAFESNVEKQFAEDLARTEGVKVFTKLPRWFSIATPLGPYHPDWVVVAQTDEGEKLFFVAETKDTPFVEALRESEKAKIHCGEQHFQALRVGERLAEYRVVSTVEELLTS